MSDDHNKVLRSPDEAADSIDDLPGEEHPIILSSKTLVHISSGLYRNTANALKELISNSFDADAKVVRINTNFPEFDVLTCSDDGEGMHIKDFKDLMDGGIGNSLKRTGETITDFSSTLTKSERPVIGRLGIGMLAIAQVCFEFKVVSHHRESGTAFEAIIDLNPYRVVKASAEDDQDEYQIGRYKCEPIVYDASQAGFLISTNDLLPTYTSRYKEDVRRENFRNVPKNFSQFIKEATKEKNKTVATLGDYWRLFWELAIASPVPYVEDAPIRKELIESALEHDSREDTAGARKTLRDLHNQLKRYNFNVIVDGVTLRKPILFPNNEEDEIEARLTPISYNDKVIGQPLKFRGYIYTQSSKAIYPRELRGLLIRLKNVAIGNYDLSCLNYESVQGFRFDWISGEVYVDEGLEEALNVDRNSFNEVHPHYIELQKQLHQLLKGAISEARRGSDTKHKTSEKEAERNYIKAIQRVVNTKYKIQHVADHDPGDTAVEIDQEKHTIVVHDSHPLWPSRKSKRQLVEKVLTALKLAQMHSEPSESFEEKFLAILKEVL